jgi:hypothetical protein
VSVDDDLALRQYCGIRDVFDDGDADLEIGLRWNRRRNDFDVSMRFEIVGSNVVADSRDEPLGIDVASFSA